MDKQAWRRLDSKAATEPAPERSGRDWLLAVGVGAAGVGLTLTDTGLPAWAQLVPAGLAAAFVPFRRERPLFAVAIVNVVAAIVVTIAVRGTEVADVGSPAGIADIVLFYSLCRWSTPARAAIGFGICVSAELVIMDATTGLAPADWVVVLPWAVLAAFALAMRYRAAAIAGRREQARTDERHALARELHDTVAHHVSAIAVQAQAGQYVVGTDPAAAATALRTIETIANESIEEMRRMVGILRDDRDLIPTVVPNSLRSLAIDHGSPLVRVHGEVALDRLPAGVGAALYRIAQESITNARKHSRNVSHIDVTLNRANDQVRLVVENDGTPTRRNAGSGYGQIGMRERVEAFGGVFSSNAQPVDGWRTETSIPLTRMRQ